MRKLLFSLFAMALIALVAARSLLPEPLAVQEAMAQSQGYNILDLDVTLAPETAGSALIADMNAYYLFRTPTEKTGYTGLLQGRSLILICADDWQPDLSHQDALPTLCRLWRDGAHFTDFYRPDWYQDMDGREFALLTGIVPTNVNGNTALSHVGQQDIYLPYSLGRAFSHLGYTTLASYSDMDHTAAYEALGFTRLYGAMDDPLQSVEQLLPTLSGEDPFLAYFVWEGNDCEPALARLWAHLLEEDMLDSTVVCLLTGNSQEHRGQLFLWARDLYGKSSDIPCSELDVTPTLLNLFGYAYDSRFLSGRDVFAPAPAPGIASATTPVVMLYGSAYSDWVTAAGSYIAAGSVFWQNAGYFDTGRQVSDYVNTISQTVYDRYIFARKVMENDYFRLVLAP